MGNFFLIKSLSWSNLQKKKKLCANNWLDEDLSQPKIEGNIYPSESEKESEVDLVGAACTTYVVV